MSARSSLQSPGASHAMGNAAFTLIELSIVLVIIGLIVGGVVGGKALVHQARLQKVVTQANGYKTAFNAFKMQYDGIPGDMKDAHSYWGSACAAVAGKCNGDGDGKLDEQCSGCDHMQEFLRFWQHLGLAEIIPGKYAGKSVDAFVWGSIGVNVPKGPLTGSGFGAWYPYFNGLYGKWGNLIYLGAYYDQYLNGGILLPKDAASIDKKVDDGLVDHGSVRIYPTEMPNNQCATPLGFNPVVVATGAYDLDSTTVACAPAFFLD